MTTNTTTATNEATIGHCAMCGKPGTAGSECVWCPCAHPIPHADGSTAAPLAEREHILQFFAYEHLPPHLAAVSKQFAQLAYRVMALPCNPERAKALDKLLEAKDAAVRALVAKGGE